MLYASCNMTLKAGVHKFSKNLGATLKCLAPGGSQEAKFHTDDPQILGASVQNLVARNLCTPDLKDVHTTLLREKC
jgi:hypothetical protein